jgi:hypothetical protein
MRLRTQIIGGLNLFRATAGPFGDEETRMARHSPTWPRSAC